MSPNSAQVIALSVVIVALFILITTILSALGFLLVLGLIILIFNKRTKNGIQ